MLTDEQIRMLKCAARGMEFSNWESHDGEIMRYLMSEGLVASDCQVSPNYFHATQKGLAKLSEIENASAHKAKQEAQQRFQNKISVASVLVPAITFILGLITEHFSGVIGILAKMFH